jgi:hypothetical protein
MWTTTYFRSQEKFTRQIRGAKASVAATIRRKPIMTKYIKSGSLLIYCLTAMLCFFSAGGEAAVFNVKMYGARGDGLNNDGPAVRSAVQAALHSGEGNDVLFPPGKYLLSDKPDIGGAAITITGGRNLRISGTANTTLIVDSPNKSFFSISNSSDVSISSFSFVRNPILYSQVKIDSIDLEQNSVVAQTENGFPSLDSEFVRKSKWLMVFSDPASGTWGDHDLACGWYNPHDRSVCWPPSIVRTDKLDGEHWRIFLNTKPRQTYIGAEAVFWGGKFYGEAFDIRTTDNFSARDIRYYPGGAEGGFRLSRNTGTFSFFRFSTNVQPQTKQLLAGIGGAMVFNNHIRLALDHSTISRVWDDDLNIGANFARIYSQPGPRTLEVDGSRGDFRVGDRVGIWDWATKAERMRAKIVATSCSLEGHSACLLNLDVNVTTVRVGRAPTASAHNDRDGIDRVIDLDSAGNLIVNESSFQAFHAHGIIDRASSSTIVGSEFRDTAFPAILIGADAYWDEGPPVETASIRGNRFRNVGGSAILIDNWNTPMSLGRGDIDIIDNVFIGSGRFVQGIQGDPNGVIFVTNLSQGHIAGNRFLSATEAPEDKRPPVIIQGSAGVAMVP